MAEGGNAERKRRLDDVRDNEIIASTNKILDAEKARVAATATGDRIKHRAKERDDAQRLPILQATQARDKAKAEIKRRSKLWAAKDAKTAEGASMAANPLATQRKMHHWASGVCPDLPVCCVLTCLRAVLLIRPRIFPKHHASLHTAARFTYSVFFILF
jgi:hypothetical protein